MLRNHTHAHPTHHIRPMAGTTMTYHIKHNLADFTAALRHPYNAAELWCVADELVSVLLAVRFPEWEDPLL